MAVRIRKGNRVGDINLTPMIDMVFNLLIFFLVAAQLGEEDQKALDVRLPEASEARPLTAVLREFVVHIDKDGRYFAGGEFVDLEKLGGMLEQASINNPGRQTVIIRADRRCVWQYIVTVMDRCNKARIRDYRVTTAEPED